LTELNWQNPIGQSVVIVEKKLERVSQEDIGLMSDIKGGILIIAINVL